MGPVKQLETSLDGINKTLPKIPENGKKAIVQYLPWLSLIIGALTAWLAWSLWHWAHIASVWADYANSWSRAFGGEEIVSERMSAILWVSFIVVIVEAALYILAFPALNAKKKMGWNMLFLGSLVNLAYGVIVLFTDYGSAGNLIGSIIGTAVGWYFLFQIRDAYINK